MDEKERARWLSVLKCALLAVEAFDPATHPEPAEDDFDSPKALVALVMAYGRDLGVTAEEASAALNEPMWRHARR